MTRKVCFFGTNKKLSSLNHEFEKGFISDFENFKTLFLPKCMCRIFTVSIIQESFSTAYRIVLSL